MGGESLIFDYGRVYLVLEKRVEKTLRAAEDFVFSGSDLMCISRLHPDLLQESFSGKCAESIWLSERNGTNNVPPDQLSRIIHRVTVFLGGRKNPVVLLDGIEYLTLFNDFNRVNMFLEQLNDMVMASGAILLVPIDPLSLDPRSLARLRRYAEVVQ